jgi:hypothetical protein
MMELVDLHLEDPGSEVEPPWWWCRDLRVSEAGGLRPIRPDTLLSRKACAAVEHLLAASPSELQRQPYPFLTASLHDRYMATILAPPPTPSISESSTPLPELSSTRAGPDVKSLGVAHDAKVTLSSGGAPASRVGAFAGPGAAAGSRADRYHPSNVAAIDRHLSALGFIGPFVDPKTGALQINH